MTDTIKYSKQYASNSTILKQLLRFYHSLLNTNSGLAMKPFLSFFLLFFSLCSQAITLNIKINLSTATKAELLAIADNPEDLQLYFQMPTVQVLGKKRFIKAELSSDDEDRYEDDDMTYSGKAEISNEIFQVLAPTMTAETGIELIAKRQAEMRETQIIPINLFCLKRDSQKLAGVATLTLKYSTFSSCLNLEDQSSFFEIQTNFNQTALLCCGANLKPHRLYFVNNDECKFISPKHVVCKQMTIRSHLHFAAYTSDKETTEPKSPPPPATLPSKVGGAEKNMGLGNSFSSLSLTEQPAAALKTTKLPRAKSARTRPATAGLHSQNKH